MKKSNEERQRREDGIRKGKKQSKCLKTKEKRQNQEGRRNESRRLATALQQQSNISCHDESSAGDTATSTSRQGAILAMLTPQLDSSAFLDVFCQRVAVFDL